MSSTHIVSIYDEELKYLSRRISEMGGTAEQMVADSVRALVTTDAALAQKVISEDVILDNAERQINEKAIVTIAKRQPMAADLREIMGAIRIAAELERVGDLGKNTAKRVIAYAAVEMVGFFRAGEVVVIRSTEDVPGACRTDVFGVGLLQA